MIFSINYILPPFEEITLHKCSNASNSSYPKIISYLVKMTKYLELLLDCNLLIVKLRSIMFKFNVLKSIISPHTFRIIYLSLHQSIL